MNVIDQLTDNTMLRSTSIASYLFVQLEASWLIQTLALAWSVHGWNQLGGWVGSFLLLSRYLVLIYKLQAELCHPMSYCCCESALPLSIAILTRTQNNSFLYDFKVPDQAGTFWYHSHLCASFK